MSAATQADQGVLKAAAGLIDAGEAFVLVTVVSVQGSTPRNAGARLLWRPATSDLPNGAVGTVGGGQFEHLVLEAARAHYQARSHALERFVLGADADQCCGGVMEVFFEYHGRPTRVVVFGAGHVSQALHGLLRGTPLDVTIVDDRAEWNTPERFEGARLIGAWDEGVRAALRSPAGTLAVVMTCSHDTDFELLRDLLRGAPAPAFVGLIGSKSKRACLFGRLVASGLDEALVRRVHCPIGVGDTGKEPRAVAISIAAQLLMEAKALAAR